MRGFFARSVVFVPILSLTFLLSVSRLASQTSTGLNLQMYAGLSITGAVRSVHIIQYRTNLDAPDGWHCLDIVQLTNNPHLHIDATTPAREQRFYRAIAGPEHFTWIHPGTFVLGSPASEVGRRSDEGPQTQVTLTSGFFMDQYEVTQGEYLEVTGRNPSTFPDGPNWPVDMVSWLDAMDYCAKLTDRERSAQRLPEGWVYRLPTEAEWEYACRAGRKERYSHGDDSSYGDLQKYAWYGDPTGGRSHPVGTRLPNSWGLYDMHGNLWELCLDVMVYSGDSVINPDPTTYSDYVSRGGSWHSLAPRCRSASRNPYTQTGKEPWVGFRVVIGRQL